MATDLILTARGVDPGWEKRGMRVEFTILTEFLLATTFVSLGSDTLMARLPLLFGGSCAVPKVSPSLLAS